MVERGGLHIVGTERHESRRVDNQLRGRSGRQGDPGSSRFYLSLEDDLLRIFGSQRIQGIMDRLGMEEGEPIEHKLVTRAIGTAQKRVETHNFEIRKHLLEYDDVMNKQREIIYGMRRQILDGESQAETVTEWMEDWLPRPSTATRPRARIPRTGTWPAWPRRSTGSSTCGCPPPSYEEAGSRTALGRARGRRGEGALRASGSRSWVPSCSAALERHEMMHPSSTRSGRTTCCPSTTSRRASACAATASATRSPSTRRRRSTCSRTWSSA